MMLVKGRVKLAELRKFVIDALAKGKRILVPCIFVLANNSEANVDAYRYSM